MNRRKKMQHKICRGKLQQLESEEDGGKEKNELLYNRVEFKTEGTTQNRRKKIKTQKKCNQVHIYVID